MQEYKKGEWKVLVGNEYKTHTLFSDETLATSVFVDENYNKITGIVSGLAVLSFVGNYGGTYYVLEGNVTGPVE